jgi:hypothetical protein
MTVCVLLIVLLVPLLWLAYIPMGWLLRFLRIQSNIPGERSQREVGPPAEIVGTFERIIAFFAVLFFLNHAFVIIAFWLGAKIAASWQRYPIDPKSADAGRSVRSGQLCALIVGIVSVSIGAALGLVVRWACPVLADGLHHLAHLNRS